VAAKAEIQEANPGRYISIEFWDGMDFGWDAALRHAQAQHEAQEALLGEVAGRLQAYHLALNATCIDPSCEDVDLLARIAAAGEPSAPERNELESHWHETRTPADAPEPPA